MQKLIQNPTLQTAIPAVSFTGIIVSEFRISHLIDE